MPAPNLKLMYVAWCVVLSLFVFAQTWSSSGASAQTTNIIIDVDGTIALTCIDPLEFTITSGDITTNLAGGTSNDSGIGVAAGNVNAIANGSELEVQLPAIPGAGLTGDPASYDLTTVGCRIETTPAFRFVNVDISLTGNRQLIGPNGSQITVNDARARLSGSNDPFSRNFRYFALFHIFGDRLLEFQINVDLSGATSAGLHSSPVSGTMTVEVTSP